LKQSRHEKQNNTKCRLNTENKTYCYYHDFLKEKKI
jgi:hypothetical protein